MILVITGTQKFQFDRLLRAVDDLIDRGVIQEEVFAQTGSSHYVPQNFKGQAYLSKEDLLSYMKQSDIIITHGGTASILDAVRMGKKVIAVPRLKKYKEHVDDHQMEIIRQFSRDGIIEGVNDVGELEKALANIKQKMYAAYISGKDEVISELRKILQII